MLLVTCAFCAWILRWDISILSLTLLIINSVLGHVQEKRSRKAIIALRQKLHFTSRVLRNGLWQKVQSIELVPNDVIRIRPGDFVPADCVIREGFSNLQFLNILI